uniref:DUF1618 domain-containing protein n=1 Tax=Oryza punctata TaxID=4537 RepID=A0A0E0MD09_ORYPU
METQPTEDQGGGGSGGGVTGGYLRWVMLEHYGEYQGYQRDDSSPPLPTPDAKTEATSVSSGGHLVRVSLFLDAPPASSCVCFDSFPRIDRGACLSVVAAHGDSMLVRLSFEGRRYSDVGVLDYFVYNAGAAAAAGDPPRPPSLSLLPAYVTTKVGEEESETWRRRHHLDQRTTGLLRRGGDDEDLVVVDLAVMEGYELEEAELLVLRSGEWSVTRAPVVHLDGTAEKLTSWITDMAVPVGDRWMCWADLYRGVILCDVFDKNLQLRFVSLPPEALTGKSNDDGYHARRYVITDRSVCVTGGGAALKFIDVTPRCCCGRSGPTYCDHSTGAFIMKTWILKVDDDAGDMAWTMDAMVDATELWSSHAYAGLPHANPEHPVVSIDDPHLIYFMVNEKEFEGRNCRIKETWMILFDTRSKMLLSVTSCGDSLLTYHPSKISSYFTSDDPSCSNAATSEPHVVDDIVAANDTIIGDSVPSSSESSGGGKHRLRVSGVASPDEIFAALEEIPELSRHDLLRAYSMLCHDNGRRFRSLLGLPMSLRKTWLLMEIQICEACSLCCGCMTDLQNA